MVARIAGFRSRDDLGMRPPDSVSYNISPSTGGCVGHWGGPAPTIRSHADCEATWRGYQRYHMGKDWADIAYTAGFCQHGYVLAGRGLGVRSAANGTNDGNQRYYAFVWVGGEGMTPTAAALDALDWLVDNARDHGAGLEALPHEAFTGSRCPGSDVAAHVATLDRMPIGTAPTQEDDDVIERDDTGDPVVRLKWRINLYLHGEADPRAAGKSYGLPVSAVFDAETEAYVRHVQSEVGWTKHPGKVDAALLALLHDLVFDHEVRA